MAPLKFEEPITDCDLEGIVNVMRFIGVDAQQHEVKSAKRELTKDLARTVSAFSNGSGGFIICGLSEKDGFVPVPGFNAPSIADAIAQTCVDKVYPTVRPSIQTLPFEGAPVVVAGIPEMRPRDKPCYVRASDRYRGSYIRTGDGDMHLSDYEVDRLIEEHGQPQHDIAVVMQAGIDDLNQDLLHGLLAREQRVHVRNFARLADERSIDETGHRG